ncbi:hypothetical protein BOTBODRAFT_495689 [Botryobasidium botryosum FD-172 SS1]|uniref:C2H2-type domain-containing protein n=1 Tax=Botryobasidium botryosum (strain FD-172 SS1) TaxID=930990 RepID=A0A067M3R5_BOTB1|nr:hypothetical protein BOTBODRAFT_495689 [Botryobasidium botryosum FD-172 SS1]
MHTKHTAPPDSSPTHRCQPCGRSFTNKSHLNRHIRHKHQREQCYRCEVAGCGYRSQQRGNVILHMKSHESPSAFKCTFCARVLKSSSGKTKHEEKCKFHYGCQEADCPETYPTEAELLQHMQQHQDKLCEDSPPLDNFHNLPDCDAMGYSDGSGIIYSEATLYDPSMSTLALELGESWAPESQDQQEAWLQMFGPLLLEYSQPFSSNQVLSVVSPSSPFFTRDCQHL